MIRKVLRQVLLGGIDRRERPRAVARGVGIGLPGGAVYVRTSWMTPWRRTNVALAGAIANATLAVLLLALTAVFADSNHLVFWSGMAFLGFLQVTAVVLNLLPIPGLDGYGALEPHLSPETQRALAPAKQFGFFILLILLIAPGLNQWFWDIVLWFFDFSGVSRGLVANGAAMTTALLSRYSHARSLLRVAIQCRTRT